MVWVGCGVGERLWFRDNFMLGSMVVQYGVYWFHLGVLLGLLVGWMPIDV